jgi:hypothetical protein
MIITKKIFQVIDHIAGPEELVYFAARESLKIESQNSEDKKFYKNIAEM